MIDGKYTTVPLLQQIIDQGDLVEIFDGGSNDSLEKYEGSPSRTLQFARIQNIDQDTLVSRLRAIRQLNKIGNTLDLGPMEVKYCNGQAIKSEQILEYAPVFAT